MRIVYGAFAQGQGHFSKAAVLVPLLESRGHEVVVVSSGRPGTPPGYAFSHHLHFPGLAYEVSSGRPDFLRTFRRWLRELPLLTKNLMWLRQFVRRFRPDLILTDFEPLVASPLIEPPCEVVGLSRQLALLDRDLPSPLAGRFERKLTRSCIRLFTAGVDRRFGFHFEPATSRCLPPVVRNEVLHAAPEDGDHVLVYNGAHAVGGGAPKTLIDWANRNRQPARVYGMPQVARGRWGYAEFRPFSRAGMLDDLRTARAVVTTAGFTTPVEAFLLGKPVMVVPIARHWEQQANAFHLQRAGLAAACHSWDYQQVLDLPRPSRDHPLRGWLQTPAERILDHVVDDLPLKQTPEELLPPKAA